MVRCFTPFVLVFFFLFVYVSPAKGYDDEPGHGHVNADHEDVAGEKPSVVPWTTDEALFNPELHKEQLVDTTIAGFHHYDFHQTENRFYASKGNVGHAVRWLRFAPDLSPGFSFTPDTPYSGYRFSLDSIRYHRPVHVFSELFYVLGSEREQLFYAKHNQRLHERVTGGLKYQTVNSPGLYSRLGSRNANFLLYLEGEPRERYRAAGSLIINRIINQESGGLRDHRSFEEDDVRDSVLVYSAESRRRGIAFRIQQSYQAGVYREDDTLSYRSFVNLGQLRHVFTYKRQALVFDEPVAPSPFFYADEEPHNVQFTFDSTLVQTITNQLNWMNTAIQPTGQRVPLHVNVFVRHQLTNIRQPLLDAGAEEGEYAFERERYAHFETGLQIASDPTRFFSFDGFAHHIAGGYNDQDYSLGGSVSLGDATRPVRLSLQAAYAEQEAPYLYHRFRSNYVDWHHQFRKSRTVNTGLRLLIPRISLEADYYLLNRPVFMNAEAYPEQPDQSFSVVTTALSTNLEAGFIRTKHKLLYQHVGEDQYERFPKWISHHLIYADFSLFDEALFAHVGFDMRYNAPYKPMAYMPVHRQFYAQDDYESGHSLLLDVFVNAKISRVRLFVKFENILGLVTDIPPVYDIPFYPLPETMFKFGVSWMFFD